MSQLPVLGLPAVSSVKRSVIERCWNSGLPKVIGEASSAVGPAEAGNGVKSENRVPSAIAAEAKRIMPHENASVVRTWRGLLVIVSMLLIEC